MWNHLTILLCRGVSCFISSNLIWGFLPHLIRERKPHLGFKYNLTTGGQVVAAALGLALAAVQVQGQSSSCSLSSSPPPTYPPPLSLTPHTCPPTVLSPTASAPHSHPPPLPLHLPASPSHNIRSSTCLTLSAIHPHPSSSPTPAWGMNQHLTNVGPAAWPDPQSTS